MARGRYTGTRGEDDAPAVRGAGVRGGGGMARGTARRLVGASAARESRPARHGTSPLARRLEAFFAGEPETFADVELDLEDGFYGDCARALRAVPRGEVVTYGELAALAGRPGAARAAGTFCARNHLSPFVPCHRVVASDGIGSFGGARRRVQAPPAGARACRSLTSCATSSPRSRPPGAAARWPSCRRSATPREPGTSTATRSLSVELDLSTPAAARRAFRAAARPRRPLGDPHLPAPCVRPRHPLPAPSRRRAGGGGDAARGGRALGGRRAARPAAEARRSAAPAAAAPTSAALSSAPGALSGPNAPQLEIRATDGEGARAPRRRRRRATAITLKVIERRTHAAAYAKSGETIADLLALAGAGETALRLDEHAVVAATRSDANRLANADEANVKRTVQAAQQQLEAIRQLDLDALPREAPGDRRAAPEAPGALARRACARNAGRRSRRRRRTTEWPCCAARERADERRRGSSEDELPPCTPHSTVWRRTGSESGAKNEHGLRRRQYLAPRRPDSRAFVKHKVAQPRQQAAGESARSATVPTGEREVRRAAPAAGRDQRPLRSLRAARLGPAGADAAEGRADARRAARDAQGGRARQVHVARDRQSPRGARALRGASTNTTRSRRA